MPSPIAQPMTMWLSHAVPATKTNDGSRPVTLSATMAAGMIGRCIALKTARARGAI
jgi:hypothetical protein